MKKVSVLALMVFLFGAVLGVGCGKVKSTTEPTSSGGSGSIEVSGTVVDSSGKAVSGARLELRSDPVVVTSTADGSWKASLDPGEHTIIVYLNSKTIFKATFTLGADKSVSNVKTEIGKSLSGGAGGLSVTPEASAVTDASGSGGGGSGGGGGTGSGGGSSDTQYPSAPSGVTAVVQCSPRRVDLSWGAATDNVGVVGYKIYRNENSTLVGVTTGTSITDTSPIVGVNVSYTVHAYDAAGNVGVNGGVNVNTAACAS